MDPHATSSQTPNSTNKAKQELNPKDITFCPPTLSDLPAIAAIYNHAVRFTAATFDTEEKPPENFAPFIPQPPLQSPSQAQAQSQPNSSPTSTPSITSPATSHSIATTPTPNQNRILLATDAKGNILGYAGTYPFSTRTAYAQLAELTIYIDPGHQNRGVGTALLNAIHSGSFLKGLYTVIALVNSESEHVIRVLGRLGYLRRGEMVGVAEKFGRRFSLVLLQRDVGGGGGGCDGVSDGVGKEEET